MDMAISLDVHVGVDVGGTNTDAVVLTTDSVIGWAKHVTTADITTGVRQAIRGALNHALEQQPSGDWVFISQKSALFIILKFNAKKLPQALYFMLSVLLSMQLYPKMKVRNTMLLAVLCYCIDF